MRRPGFAILDPNRVVKRGRTINWDVSRRTYLRFRELLEALVDAELEAQDLPEVQQRMATLRDDIRHLPGYPRGYDPEHDLIVPVVTTAQGR